MQRFRVTGIDKETGLETEVVVEAISRAYANEQLQDLRRNIRKFTHENSGELGGLYHQLPETLATTGPSSAGCHWQLDCQCLPTVHALADNPR